MGTHAEYDSMDISPEADLDKLFRPLHSSRTSEMLLGKDKARLKERIRHHPSWLRIYALRLTSGSLRSVWGVAKGTSWQGEFIA